MRTSHDLIKTGDPDSFVSIQDRNGEVCLDYCRRCKKGEGELAPNCETDEELLARIHGTRDGWGAFLGHANECSGSALDECAAHVGLNRGVVKI